MARLASAVKTTMNNSNEIVATRLGTSTLLILAVAGRVSPRTQ